MTNKKIKTFKVLLSIITEIRDGVLLIPDLKAGEELSLLFYDDEKEINKETIKVSS